jgi:DNA-binding NtrC family response regulator
LGAADFLEKPLDLEAVSVVARTRLQRRRVTQSWRHSQKRRAQAYGLHQIVGSCAGIERAKSLARRVAEVHVSGAKQPPNVLITGETGTGKDLFARALHYEGARRDGPFVHVNCAALPESLIESELFGHVRGAFTDARSNKRGLLEVAEGGTLFLDEVGTLPLSLQAKLLTAIETRRIRPVGGDESIDVDVHFVAAMNQDPEGWIREGRFREDLYQRLKVVTIDLPPLRERGNDIVTLARRFVETYCRKFGMELKPLSARGLAALRAYDWPGNVRELSNAMESATLLSGSEIEAELLPGGRVHARSSEMGRSSEMDSNGHVIRIDFSEGPVSLEGIEKRLIQSAMSSADQNVSRAARLLSISRDTLRYRLEKHGMDWRGNGAPEKRSQA